MPEKNKDHVYSAGPACFSCGFSHSETNGDHSAHIKLDQDADRVSHNKSDCHR